MFEEVSTIKINPLSNTIIYTEHPRLQCNLPEWLILKYTKCVTQVVLKGNLSVKLPPLRFKT